MSELTHLKFRILIRIGFDGGGLTGKSGVSRKNFPWIQKSVRVEGFLDPLHDFQFGTRAGEMEGVTLQESDSMLRRNRALVVLQDLEEFVVRFPC